MITDFNITALKFYETLYYSTENGAVNRFDIDNNTTEKILDISHIIYDFSKIDNKFAILFGDNSKKQIAIFEKNLEILPHNFNNVKNIFMLQNLILTVNFDGTISFYDLNSHQIQNLQISHSMFGGSDFNTQTMQLFVGNEGGEVFVIDVMARKIVNQFYAHKDFVNSIKVSNDTFVSGSTDRKVFYKSGKKEFFIQSDFIVYAVGNSGENIAFCDENYVRIFNDNSQEIRSIKYSGVLLNSLIFTQKYLIGAGFDNKIYFWEIL